MSRFSADSSRMRRSLSWAWLLTAAALCLGPSGCVRRRMTVRSNPPGAAVYVDDYEIGTTPVSHNFTYYGTRKIRLVKDGYETLTVLQRIPAPWYQIPPLDFVSENLVPGEIRDQRTLSYQLVPQRVVPTEALLERAEGFRGQARPSGFTRASTGMPVGGVPARPADGPYLTPGGQPSGGQPVRLLPSQQPTIERGP